MIKDEKVAIVTGATSGIGEAIAYALAKNGFDLIITGRREDKLNKVASKIIKDYNTDVIQLNLDVRIWEDVQNTISNLTNKWKEIDLLVNNAGLAVGLESIEDGIIEDWERMIDTNIKGLLYMTRAVAPLMIERKKGHIINIGSIAGKSVYPNGNVYCATKHSVDALSRAMTYDLNKHSIKVSQVSPGAVETEFSIVRFKGDVEKASNVYKGFKPLSAKDVADSVMFIVNAPEHVNISDLVIMPSAQASATQIRRES